VTLGKLLMYSRFGYRNNDLAVPLPSNLDRQDINSPIFLRHDVGFASLPLLY